MISFTASQLAEKIKGVVSGDGAVVITGLRPAEIAGSGDLVFADNERHFAAAEKSAAAAVLVSGSFTSTSKTLIRVPDARIAVARLLPIFFAVEQYPAGIAPTAVVHPTATVDPSAHVGPGCVLGAGVRVGARTALLGGNHVGRDSVLGEDVLLYPNVVLYSQTQVGNRVAIHSGTVIGSDGYGYVLDEGRHRKVLQVGNVIIHDDVEIGANVAIDRGALGPTVIGQGTKIDNLVHVAHNVEMGRHCLVLGQVGFAGSTRLGDYGVVASQSGIAGHLKLGSQCVIGAKSGVMRDVADRETVMGIPAQPDRQMKRQWIAQQQLPELLKRMRELEKQVAVLQASVAENATSGENGGLGGT